MVVVGKTINLCITVYFLFTSIKCLKMGMQDNLSNTTSASENTFQIKNFQKPKNSENTKINDVKNENKEITMLHFAQFQFQDCNKYNCPSSRGQCLDLKICACREGYLEIPSLTKFYGFCGYEQRSALISFLFEFIFIGGVGHIYAKRFMIGTVKFLCFLIMILIYSQLKKKTGQQNKLNFLNILGFIVLSIFFLIHFYDIILILMNEYTDGNGLPLSSIKIR